MTNDKKMIDTDKFGTSWIIFAFSFLVFLLIIWYSTKDSFWTGLIAFSISFFLAIVYYIYSNSKTKKNANTNNTNKK